MYKLTRNTPCLYLSFILLISSMLACGGTAPPVAFIPVENTPTPAPFAVTATQEISLGSLGSSPENPAPGNETVATADWEFYVVEAHRGADALGMLKKENPDPAMEYVLVKVHAKYVGSDSGTHHIDSSFFRGMDDNKVLYDKVSILDVTTPSPSMSSFDDLASGGEVEGWTVIQVGEDQQGILLVILPRDNGLQLGEETARYISLD